MKNIILLFLIGLLAGPVLAKEKKQPKSMKAHRIENKMKPKIDGVLDEDVWASNPHFFSGNFTQLRPSNGDVSEQKTDIQIIYDDFAIYIAAKMYDNPDSILRESGQRDSFNKNTDMFGVGFDTYNKKQNAFFFMVSPAGMQNDMFITPNNEDENWNAVWKSKARIVEDGWVVEIEIPYSALRFPKEEVQTWGINFMRDTKRKQEKAFWSPVDAAVDGFVNQFGVLTGLKNIEPPLRLTFTPYVSAYMNVDTEGNRTSNINGGMDLKYGINESFTLDMSLIPDFGQVRSDNVVLNLSPFEVRFDENRPFFTEGTELFGQGNVFYSRRVGKSFGSIDYDDSKEELVSWDGAAQLLNAAKVSGRTKKGLGIGIFNAVTNETTGTLRDLETGEKRDVRIDPVTNFNMLVFDKNLKNNSNISLYNTNVTRFGGNNANVTGTNINLNDKNNVYYVRARLNVSQLYNRDGEGGYDTDIGHNYLLEAGKKSGTWQYSVNRYVESHNYDPNDMGFLGNPNEVSHSARISYNVFKPKGIFNRFNTRLRIRHQKLDKPNVFTGMNIQANFFGQLKNFWGVGIFTNTNPVTGYDYFSPREEGRYFLRYASYNAGLYFETDSRKAFKVETDFGVWARPETDQIDNWISIEPRFRVNDKLSFNMELFFIKIRKERDYATTLYDDNDELTNIIFGKRDRHEYENVFQTNYNFSPTMGLNLRIRHYWSSVEYSEFYDLKENGELGPTAYSGIDPETDEGHNTTFNAFNVDLVYSWWFAPGSQLSVVWKNSIYDSHDDPRVTFRNNMSNTLRAPQTNNFSVRLLYFLDYNNLKKKLKK